MDGEASIFLVGDNIDEGLLMCSKEDGYFMVETIH